MLRLRCLELLTGGALALLLLVLASSPATVDAITFEPQFEASLSDPAPGAAADLTLEFSIPEPDANFESLIAFIPPEFSISIGSEVPDGAIVGELLASATLGLINNPCSDSIGVNFTLMDASTDISGHPHPLYSGYRDYNGNGLPENVEWYPDFLPRVAPEIQPRARFYGQTLVAGVETFINFLIFEPGTVLPGLPVLEASLGYPTVVFLNAPLYLSAPIGVTDFCSPLGSTTTLFATSVDNPATFAGEGGSELRRNPETPGVYDSLAFVRSQWDSDNDGVENQLDACPLTIDPGWSPRTLSPAQDNDLDGIPASCDPSDAEYNIDEDDDGYLNRQDICPLEEAFYYPPDSDLDGIGDVCDPLPHDQSNDGAAVRTQLCVTAIFTVGEGGPSNASTTCPGGPDVPWLYLSAGPRDAIVRVGTEMSVSAGIRNIFTFTAMPGESVFFEVTGANPANGSCVIEQWGSCNFEYMGLNPGIDLITVSASPLSFELRETIFTEWRLPPENDDISGAISIAGVPSTTVGRLAAAALSVGEPEACNDYDLSVWYSLAPVEDVFVRITADRESDPIYWDSSREVYLPPYNQSTAVIAFWIRSRMTPSVQVFRT